MICEIVKVAVLAWERPNAGKALTGVGIYLRYLSGLGNFARRRGCELELTFVVPWERDMLLQEDGYSVRLLEISGFCRKNPYDRVVLYSSCDRIADRLLNDEPRFLKQFDLLLASSFAFGELISRANSHDNISYVCHRPEFLHRVIAERAGFGRGATDRFGKDCELEAKAISSSHRILAVGEACKNELVTRYGLSRDDVLVIHNGVDTSLFRPVDNSQTLGKTIFSYVGRSDPEKGTILLLEAAKELKSRFHVDDFKLQIVTDDTTPLKREVKKLGISHNVEFVAWKDYTELPEHYSKVDFTVIPSFWESFSFVTVESLSCETPVITSTAGELPKIVDSKIGLSFRTGDKHDLADTLRKACELSTSDRRAMGMLGREKVLNLFSEEKFLESYLKFVESTVSDSN